MNKKIITKLIESDNTEDLDLGAFLLESDSLSIKDKKAFIKKYIDVNPGAFTEKEKKFLNAWLYNKNKIKNLKLWILKDL